MNIQKILSGTVLFLFFSAGNVTWAQTAEGGAGASAETVTKVNADSLRLAQFKQEVQPYLEVENADYVRLLQTYVARLDTLAQTGKKVKVKSLPVYEGRQAEALRQVVLGDVSLRDTFMVRAERTLLQKYPDRKEKYWTAFDKVTERMCGNFLSEYADAAVNDWLLYGEERRNKRLQTDGDVIDYKPGGGTSVRRVLYKESEVNPKPQFPGGEKAYKAYLQRSVKYPQEALKKKIQGAVRVGFTVKADGTISNAKVERKVSPLLDQEALRVVKAMPKWTPGYYNGKPVPVKMTLPVQFRLSVKKK